MKCDYCNGVFLDFEYVPATNSESELIVEVYSISECNFCGDPHHNLIKIISEDGTWFLFP